MTRYGLLLVLLLVSLAGFGFLAGFASMPLFVAGAIVSLLVIAAFWFLHVQDERRGRMVWDAYAERTLARHVRRR